MHKIKNNIARLIMAGAIMIPAGVYARQIRRGYTHETIIGRDRYETGAKIAERVDNLDTIILVNGIDMSDGLSASSLSGKLNATILPIKKDEIPTYSKKVIDKAKTVYIIGGKNAISSKVEDSLYSKKVIRIGGKDRFETSEKVAQYIGDYDRAYIVNGYTGQADAISISPVAAKDKSPIILTNGKTSKYTKKKDVKYTVIGGKSAVSDELAKKYSADRMGGKDRYDTNKIVINKYYKNVNTKVFANGETLVDALSASYFARNMGVVLISKDKNQELLEYKNTIQVGGVTFSIDPIEPDPVPPSKVAKMEILNEENMLNISAMPMTKEYALKTIAPYTFTVKNTGEVDLDVKICIHIASKTLPIDNSKINILVENSNGELLHEDTLNNFTEKSLKNSFSLDINEEKSFKLLAWVDGSASNSDVDSGEIDFRINVVGNQRVGE